MREIKFRAWDDITKEMFDDIQNSNVFEGFLNSGSYDIMQFTGLHDKNGKEIYGGDLLKWEHSEHLLEVRWNNIGWDLFSKLFKKFGLPDGSYCSSFNVLGYLRKSKIIGNIYENPELIKK